MSKVIGYVPRIVEGSPGESGEMMQLDVTSIAQIARKLWRDIKLGHLYSNLVFLYMQGSCVRQITLTLD